MPPTLPSRTGPSRGPSARAIPWVASSHGGDGRSASSTRSPARAVSPGGVEIDWQARPSTLPRRQGRQGRRFDFAQWYPKVVVYDRYGWEDHPLYPGGEFYGEFATYDVVLDLAQDQVIGATGVPVEGDPGWEKAKADWNLRVDYQRDWYRSPLPAPGCAAMHV